VRPSVKYAAIHANREKFEVSFMCQYFSVSRSGYYAWVKRLGQPDRDEWFGNLIRQCQEKTKYTYGYRRVQIWLLRETGLVMNKKAVLRLTRKYNLLAVIRRPRPLYQRQQKMMIYEDRLSRNFHADKPNQKWATDISYLHTKQGVLYFSVIKDLYDNFIVAYDTGTVQDNALVYRTIRKAHKEVADGLILHSDQGFQYSSHGYSNLIKEYGILPSMSRAGTPLDNAPAENFIGVFKVECFYRQKVDTFIQANQLVDEYIHFYNYERIQLKTMLTPFEKRRQLA
jgi:transposase InsO family protein